jgi:hypothetical protein
MGLSERLPTAVAEFSMAGFRLAHEVDRLDDVRGVGAHEAAIFYCSRITEQLVGAALTELHVPRSVNLFANLEALERYSAIRRDELHWAHAVRRLGNDVRHVVRAIAPDDSAVAIVFLEGILRWFFGRFPHGPSCRVDELRGRIAGGADTALVDVIDELEADDVAPEHAIRLAGVPAVARNVTVSAVLAESLIDRDHRDAADQLLTACLEHHPGDARLTQLRALVASRGGDTERALHLIEPLAPERSNDPETAGILGGILKRAASATDDLVLLQRANRAYRQGYKRSSKRSAYLGINTATTSLLLGNTDVCAQVAEKVRAMIVERMNTLGDGAKSLSLWDELTLAEADLLLGETDSAVTRYQRVFVDYADRPGALASAAQQARSIAKILDVEDRFANLGR